MKNYLTLTTIILMFLNISCVKDYNSVTETRLVNSTAHTIRIESYLNNTIDQYTAVVLQPNETKIIYKESPRGKTLDPCWGVFLQPNDSTLVIYDNARRSNHLRFTDTISDCSYCIFFENNRNISNETNYNRTVTKEEKKYMAGFFTYTFTEQDYLDAKE